MVEHTVDRVVDLLGIENTHAARWGGMKAEQNDVAG
jgi:4-hydroxy-3-polyprenylbenzoate decarboxylase